MFVCELLKRFSRSYVAIYDSFLVLTKPYFVVCNQKYCTYEKYYYYEFFFVHYILCFV